MARVLIIDDEEDLLDALQMVLETGGHHVETLADGRSAAERCDAFNPDVVLVDWVMPRENGGTVVRRLREVLRRPPGVVMMSALPDVRKEASLLHADGFLEKPFSTTDLIRTIGEVAGRSMADTDPCAIEDARLDP